MWLRLAAMAVLSAVLCESALAQTRNVLTLDDAFAHVADSHPDLRLIGSRQDVLSADRDSAGHRSAMQLRASRGSGIALFADSNPQHAAAVLSAEVPRS